MTRCKLLAQIIRGFVATKRRLEPAGIICAGRGRSTEFFCAPTQEKLRAANPLTSS
jgi:hypothetical protein